MLDVCVLSRVFRQIVEKLFCGQLSILYCKKLDFILRTKAVLKIWELQGKTYVENSFFS